MVLTPEEAKVLRDEVFGPCSAIYECMEIKDIIEGAVRCTDLAHWFEIQTSVEDVTMDRMGIPSKEFNATMDGYKQRFAEYLAKR